MVKRREEEEEEEEDQYWLLGLRRRKRPAAKNDGLVDKIVRSHCIEMRCSMLITLDSQKCSGLTQLCEKLPVNSMFKA